MSPDNNPLLCRCWDSIDARTATPTRLSFEILEKDAGEIVRAVPGTASRIILPPSPLNDRGHLISVDYFRYKGPHCGY